MGIKIFDRNQKALIISYQLDNQGFFDDDRETYFHGSNLTRIYIYIYIMLYIF